MPDQPTEVRCPTCRKLLLGLSPDFYGVVSAWCGRCKADRVFPAGLDIPNNRLNCSCGRWLGKGVVIVGQVWARCRTEKLLVVITPTGVLHAEQVGPPLIEARLPSPIPVQQRPSDKRLQIPRRSNAELVALIEAKWRGQKQAAAKRSTEVAVGLRFDVFSRDGFRCRYCGRGPAEGVFLEADHVVPRAAGGPDTLGNLVTACWDCNRGKSAKVLTQAVIVP